MESGNKNLPVNIPKIEKKLSGRPSAYSQEDADNIIDLIGTTSLGISPICKRLGLNYSTVWRWLDKNIEGFWDRYVRAKAQQQELVADEIMEIIDRKTDKNDMAEAQMNKLAFEGRRWLMGKLAPGRFGDKITVDAPVQPKNLSEEQFNQLLGKIVVDKVEEKKVDEGYTEFEEIKDGEE